MILLVGTRTTSCTFKNYLESFWQLLILVVVRKYLYIYIYVFLKLAKELSFRNIAFMNSEKKTFYFSIEFFFLFVPGLLELTGHHMECQEPVAKWFWIV